MWLVIIIVIFIVLALIQGSIMDSEESKILETRIVASSSRQKMGSSVVKGAVGGALLGPVGMVGGALSGGKKNETKFLIKYKDGTKVTKTVENDSPAFDMYCKYLKD